MAEQTPRVAPAPDGTPHGAHDRGDGIVTFALWAPWKSSVHLIGDFNNWDRHSTMMKRQPDGSWKSELVLDCGKEYHFRYLINGREWHNEWEADRYAVHPLGGENSVLMI